MNETYIKKRKYLFLGAVATAVVIVGLVHLVQGIDTRLGMFIILAAFLSIIFMTILANKKLREKYLN